MKKYLFLEMYSTCQLVIIQSDDEDIKKITEQVNTLKNLISEISGVGKECTREYLKVHFNKIEESFTSWHKAENEASLLSKMENKNGKNDFYAYINSMIHFLEKAPIE